jgi:DNA-binding LytR/AlgR family response regulator
LTKLPGNRVRRATDRKPGRACRSPAASPLPTRPTRKPDHRASLATLERQLDPDEFVRIHRSTIIRVARVREMEPWFHGEYTVVLADGTRLKLSRTYRAKLQAALGEEL